MKNLILISFVGVDTKTNLDNLLKFKNNKFKCEFGILFSEAKSTSRYPDYNFCKDFLNWGKENNILTSLHLCGSEAITKYIEQDAELMQLCKLPNRIQLNINIGKYPDYDLLSNKILSTVTAHSHKIILQQNKTKEKFIDNIILMINSRNVPDQCINLLHDSSGGFGREISKVIKPDNIYFTGYAGGINPENANNIVKLIDSVNLDNKPYYIDMESGIRVNNIFSLEKCQHIIDNILK